MSRWIGLTGRMGAGKDYTYRKIRDMHSLAQRVSFADQLRKEIERELGQTVEGPQRLDPLWEKPYSEPIRRLLQWWGTDFRRAENPDYWVEAAEREALMLTLDALPVFTDVRFPNEADMIRDRGGLIVRVMAPPEVREERLGMIPPNHASETSMDDYEVDMHVTSTVENEAYEGQVRRILVEATYDDIDFLARIKESLDGRG